MKKFRAMATLANKDNNGNITKWDVCIKSECKSEAEAKEKAYKFRCCMYDVVKTWVIAE